MSLPTDAKARKAVPLYTGLVRYFPDALCAVAEVSRIGNDQQNPGQPIHWDRSKSADEHDALVRHLIDAGRFDSDGARHSAKVAWRALAALQKELEAEAARPRLDTGTGFRPLAAAGCRNVVCDLPINHEGACECPQPLCD